MNSVFTVGLTGPIASGKSTVLGMMENLGAATWNADAAVHALQLPDTSTTQKIAHVFGQGILAVDGSVDRQKLSQTILGDADKLKELQGIIYPELVKQCEAWCLEQTAEVIVLEAPLLFEAGLDALCDVTVSCSCEEGTSKERALSRQGMTSEKYDFLRSQQLSATEFQKRCTLTLPTESIQHTQECVKQWMQQWKRHD